MALARRGDVPEAMTAFRNGLAADPAFTDSALGLSALLVARKRPLEAAEILRGTLTRGGDGSQRPASRWFSEGWSGPPRERAPLEIALAQALLAAPLDDDRAQAAMIWAQQAVQHTNSREAKPAGDSGGSDGSAGAVASRRSPPRTRPADRRRRGRSPTRRRDRALAHPLPGPPRGGVAGNRRETQAFIAARMTVSGSALQMCSCRLRPACDPKII